MDRSVCYFSGKPDRRLDVDRLLDAIADHVIADGDVEKALQQVFRLGTEDDIGLLDVLDRLREETRYASNPDGDLNQHDEPSDHSLPSDKALEDAVAMREALREVESLDDLQGLDPDLMQRALTDDEQEWIEKWADMTGQLVESGIVAISASRLVLTPRAIQRIGTRLLRHVFLPPTQRGRGNHALNRPGLHGSRGEDTSPWQWGKLFDIDVARSITNSIKRSRGSKLSLIPEDFEVFDRESAAAISTVLLIDMSRSMFESGAWDAAKRSAIALNAMMTSSQSHDHLALAGFSGDARELSLDELPLITWDQFSYGTNLHAGLLVAEHLLGRNHASNRQVVIVTDGAPTSYLDEGKPIFEHPVTARTIDATLLQATRMYRQGISFTTVCPGNAGNETSFTETFTHVVRGRMITLPLNDLGAFVVRDVSSGRFLSIH